MEKEDPVKQNLPPLNFPKLWGSINKLVAAAVLHTWQTDPSGEKNCMVAAKCPTLYSLHTKQQWREGEMDSLVC